jgi:hypothetical protein
MNISCIDICVYGQCHGTENRCSCSRAFFTGSDYHFNSTSIKLNEQCNTSVADYYPLGWLLVQIICATLYFIIGFMAFVYIYRLVMQRKKIKQKYGRQNYKKVPPCCSLRMVVFTLFIVFSFSRFFWIIIDPRGAKFIIAPRYTVETKDESKMILVSRFVEYSSFHNVKIFFS